MQLKSKSKLAMCTVMAASLMMLGMPAEARPDRAKGGAKSSVNRSAGKNVKAPKVERSRNKVVSGNNVGNKTNINNSKKNINIDNSRDVDINVDGNGRHHGGWGYDNDYHPIATAVGVTAAVAVTAAVIGAIVTPNQLPSNCVQVYRGNTSYMQCGSTWYQPQYQGSNVTYVVINQPY